MSNEQIQKVKFLQKRYVKALNTLEEALHIKENILVRDAVIKRFEYTFEISWHLMRAVIQYEGTTVDLPRETIRKAFQIGWIRDASIWEDMLDNRNSTVHIYKEIHADVVFNDIVNFYFNTLLQFKEKMEEVIRVLD